MKKITALAVSMVVASMFATSASADVQKGQRYYLKLCKECHGTGTKGAAMKTVAGWGDAFANGGATLKKAHEKDEKASKLFQDGGMFDKTQEDLRDFLKEYGSDSGNVPACG